MGLLSERLVLLMETGDFDTWKDFFLAEINKEYFKKLDDFVTNEYKNKIIYPPIEDVFAAFTTYATECKAIIIGQDPYHGEGEAMGLSFSVKNGIKCPPSLRNIKKELVDDLGPEYETATTDLTSWKNEGVFLLNTLLTVQADAPLSHVKIGWQEFTTNALEYLVRNNKQPFAVVLWGGYAKTFVSLFKNREDLLILTAPHPSPLSSYRGFFGSKPFSKINAFLQDNGVAPIDWCLDSKQ